jgi:hypothetical protein
MIENKASFTAMMTAYVRAYYAMNSTQKIFDDFLAYCLIPEEKRALIEQYLTETNPLKDTKRSVSYFNQTDTLAYLKYPTLCYRPFMIHRRYLGKGQQTRCQTVCNSRSWIGYLCISSTRINGTSTRINGTSTRINGTIRCI